LENKGRQKTMDNKDNISTVLSSIGDRYGSLKMATNDQLIS